MDNNTIILPLLDVPAHGLDTEGLDRLAVRGIPEEVVALAKL